MTSAKTQFSVGIFLIVGITMAVAAIVWVGMSHYFEKGRYFVAYFDESVQGLDKDSPVKYRGVSIGRVEKLSVAPDEKLIEVILKIESGLEPGEQIVAQLKSVGITGIMFIELDQKVPDYPASSPEINFKSPYPVIPTRPSEIKKFMEGLDDALNQIKSMDLEGISDRLKTSLDLFKQSLDSAQVENIASDFRDTLKRVQKIIDTEKWDRLMGTVESAAENFKRFANTAEATSAGLNDTRLKLQDNAEQIQAELESAIKELKSSIQSAESFFSAGTDFVNKGGKEFRALEFQLSDSLTRINRASDNFSNLLEQLSVNPSQLLFSEPPAKHSFETSP